LQEKNEEEWRNEEIEAKKMKEHTSVFVNDSARIFPILLETGLLLR
jgi:hypothetical protein